MVFFIKLPEEMGRGYVHDDIIFVWVFNYREKGVERCGNNYVSYSWMAIDITSSEAEVDAKVRGKRRKDFVLKKSLQGVCYATENRTGCYSLVVSAQMSLSLRGYVFNFYGTTLSSIRFYRQSFLDFIVIQVECYILSVWLLFFLMVRYKKVM